MKTCTKCNETKPYSEFSKDRSKKDGYKSNCKDCCKSYKDQRREFYKEYDREYYKRNKEELRKFRKAYRANRKEAIAAYGRKYLQENKEEILEHKKHYKRKIRRELTDEYIKNQIMKTDWPFGRDEITPELIDRKRLQIQLHRTIKSIR